MAISMQGSWTVKVKSKNASYKQQFVIQGSDGSDGIYEGEVCTSPVHVIGDQWTITIEHKPSGAGAVWTSSNERLTIPVRSAGNIIFDIRSNDSGADKDYNDLILTCATPESSSEYVVYGQVKTYAGLCKFNPCFPFYFVIDTVWQLKELLKFKEVRSVLQELYPERIKEFTRRKPYIKEPLPGPDPAPFRPMMVPMNGPQRELQGNVTTSSNMKSAAINISSSKETEALKVELGASRAEMISPYIRDLARIKDRIKPFCRVKEQPGLLLRFLEYDRTADELAGGSYSGEGARQVLGLTVTDEQGRYIFRFERTLEDVAEEFEDTTVSGPPLAIQLRPDLIVQIVGGMGEAPGVIFETGVYSDIPNLKAINICIPEKTINPGPSTCQGGRAIQSIGNIWTISGMGNTIDADGRVTATYSTGPQITRGAWVGRLDIFACFIDMPEVENYTIRYRRPGGNWSFVEQAYRHVFIPKIGLPADPAHKVGPFNQTLVVDGTSQTVPAYNNIESNSDWIATHRLRKIQLASALYENILYEIEESPRTVEFKIEGYDAGGNKIPGAEDSVKLCIDNRAIAGDIDYISMGGFSPGECALFELPIANTALTMKFKVRHPGGFLDRYNVNVIRGSNTSVPVTETTAPDPQPLSLDYNLGIHGNFFFGTFDAVGPDSEDYVLAILQPTLGSWLAAGKDFCAFAFEVHAVPRVTDGYSKGTSRRIDIELVGISYEPAP